MIVPDINLLVYAYDEEAPHHQAARRWWERVLSDSEIVGLPWVVVVGFVRLMTHPTLAENPMTVQQVQAAIASWLERDHVRLLSPSAVTVHRFFALLAQTGTGGNLATDAMIAALASEYGGCVYSNDRDFSRFPRLVWSNPLE
ncbi:MAG: TA system VapC family ribonuclease toxin [Planctomycetota bacterium]